MTHLEPRSAPVFPPGGGNTAMMPGMAKHAREITTAEFPVRLVPVTPDDQRKPGGWPAAVAWSFVGVIIAALATYAGAASYESVSHLAALHGIPLHQLTPLGLDGGLVGLVIADIVLTWLDEPIGWLRRVTRLFAAGVVGANIVAGYPDPVSMSLRPAAAVLFVILVEVVCTVLRRRNRKRREEAGDDSREGIPLARWMLAPVSSFVLHRRMKLWEIRSYRLAVDMELARLRAVEQMKARFGPGWRKSAPGDLVWMLRRGVHMKDALTKVAELTKPEPGEAAPAQPSGSRPGAAVRNRAGATARHKGGAGSRTAGDRSRPRAAVPDDVDTQAEALKILASEPDISGSELGRRLGLTAGRGRTIKRQLGAPAPVTGEQPRVS